MHAASCLMKLDLKAHQCAHVTDKGTEKLSSIAAILHVRKHVACCYHESGRAMFGAQKPAC